MTITMSTIERAIAIAAAAHAGPVDKPITVADILPLAIGDRTLNARDQEILRVTIHRALHKIAKRGTIVRIAPVGWIVRWRLTSVEPELL
jgi:hypothetical protein